MLVRENVLPNNGRMSEDGMTFTSIGNYYRATSTTTSRYPRIVFDMSDLKFNVGETICISYEIKSEIERVSDVIVASLSYTKLKGRASINISNNWKRETFTISVKDNDFKDVYLSFWLMPTGTINQEARDLSIRNVQINRGNAPSDIWSPPIREITAGQQGLMQYGEYKEIELF